MSFVSPWLLVALLVIPAIVAGYVAATRRRVRRSAALAAQGLVTTSASRMGRRRHVPFALFALALTVLVVALARPETKIITPHREGTVILAFDVSNSMSAKDLQPSRIEAAKTAARAFVKLQPSSIRIGVVAFGDGAVITQQPTSTQSDVIAAIDRLSVEGGTSLGQGLFESLNAIAGKPLTIDESALNNDNSGQVDIGYYGSAVVVLLSDGENNSQPDPLQIAQIASVAGVHVDAIGVGTEEGTVVSIDGFNVATALDRDLLQQIASATDGKYYEAPDATALAQIYKSIDLQFKSEVKYTEVTGLFTAAGTLLLVVGALLSVFWFGRVV